MFPKTPAAQWIPAVVILIGALAAAPAYGAAVQAVGNLGEALKFGEGVDSFPLRWVGGSFITGPNPTTLDSVDLRAELFSGVASGFTVSLYADNDGNPWTGRGSNGVGSNGVTPKLLTI